MVEGSATAAAKEEEFGGSGGAGWGWRTSRCRRGGSPWRRWRGRTAMTDCQYDWSTETVPEDVTLREMARTPKRRTWMVTPEACQKGPLMLYCQATLKL